MPKKITIKAEDYLIPCTVYLLHLYCTQYAFNRGEDNKGLFTWKEEDPKRAPGRSKNEEQLFVGFTVCRNFRPWLLTQQRAAILVWFDPGTRISLAKVVHTVFKYNLSSSWIFLPLSYEDSSNRKIPALRNKCNFLHVNLLQKTYSARMFHLLECLESSRC